MKIEQISITELNSIEVLTDENVYAIKADTWTAGKYKMVPLDECEIKQLFSGELTLIRISK